MAATNAGPISASLRQRAPRNARSCFSTIDPPSARCPCCKTPPGSPSPQTQGNGDDRKGQADGIGRSGGLPSGGGSRRSCPAAYRPGTEPPRFPMREHDMADKSPRQSMSKKSGKSIKEKRVERKAKTDVPSKMEQLTRDKKH